VNQLSQFPISAFPISTLLIEVSRERPAAAGLQSIP
jgi:hypothetical protein